MKKQNTQNHEKKQKLTPEPIEVDRKKPGENPKSPNDNQTSQNANDENKKLQQKKNYGHTNTRIEFYDFLEQAGKVKNAIEHGLAQRVYKVTDDIDSNIKIDCCHCCGLILPCDGYVEEFPVNTPLEEMKQLGIGIYLYFFYMKFLIIVLTAVIGMYSVIEIIQSKSYYSEVSNYCSMSNNKTIKFDCIDYANKTTEYLYRYSSSSFEIYNSYNYNLSVYYYNNYFNYTNIKNVHYVDLSFLNLILLITILIINFIFSTLAYNLTIERDITKNGVDDYTVMISNIPLDCNSLDEIIDLISIDNFRPVDVVVAFKVDEFLKIRDIYGDIKRKIDYCTQKNIDVYPSQELCGSDESLEVLYHQLEEKTKEIDSLLLKLKHNSFEENVFTGVVFASFNTIKEVNEYCRLFPSSLFEYIFAYFKTFYYSINIFDNSDQKLNYKKKTSFRVEMATEPNDINWENLEYTDFNRILRYIIIYFCTIVLIGIGFGIILALNYSQTEVDPMSNPRLNTFLSIVISIVISIINIILETSLKKFTEYYILLFSMEKNKTNTDEYLSYSIKLTFSTFITTSVVPLIVNIITGNFKNRKDILISNIFIIFLSNSIVTPLLYFYPPDYLIKQWKRYNLKKEAEEGKESNLNQGEMNEIFENPPIDISSKFAYLGKTILMTFLFLPIFPFGPFISLFGVVSMYFIEKYNIIKFYKIPEMLNKTIALGYFYYFKFFLFISAVSSIVFLGDIFSKWSIIVIIVFSCSLAIPFHLYMKNLLDIEEEDVVKTTYQSVYFKFEDDYLRSNPLTKQKGQEKFLEAKYKAKDLTEEEFMKMLKEIKNNVNMEDMYRLNYTSKKVKKNTIELYKKTLLSGNKSASIINQIVKVHPNRVIKIPESNEMSLDNNENQANNNDEIHGEFNSHMFNNNINSNNQVNHNEMINQGQFNSNNNLYINVKNNNQEYDTAFNNYKG